MPSFTKLPRVAKPRPDFPLFPHASGRWAKKVKGAMLYFGSTAGDPQGDAALAAWLEEKDYCLLYGRRPAKKTGGLTVGELVDRLLNLKRLNIENKELSPLTFLAWHTVCAMVLKQFGAGRHVESLGPDDFDALFRAQISGKATGTRAQYITLVRGLFHFAFNEHQRLISSPVLLGQSFRLPKRSRSQRSIGDGLRVFTPEQIHKLLAFVMWPSRAVILLGINCGFGNNDCATLTFNKLDLENGWHDHPRPKTKISRRCPLWPETITAIQHALRSRPRPRDRAHSDLVFLTRTGRPYCGFSDQGEAESGGQVEWRNALGASIRYALNKLDMRQGKLSFYALRHTFETVAGNAKDQVAVDYIMGHVTPGMGPNYRHEIADPRLQAVTDCVHDWLFPKSPASS